MTNTRPVPNTSSPFGEVHDDKGNVIGKALLISPWIQFFQQFVQKAPTIVNISPANGSYTPNQNGTLFITGVATGIIFSRGGVDINLGTVTPRIIPMAISDSVRWSGTPTIQFCGQ